MADFIQAKTIVSGIANQLIGAKYFPAYVVGEDGDQRTTKQLTAENIDEYNATILSDIGVTIENYKPAREIVYNSLLDQISKIVIDTKEFAIDMPDVYRDEAEFGLVRETVEIGIADFFDDPMWDNQGDNNYGDPARTGESEGRGKIYARKIAEMRNATYLPPMRNKIYGEGKSCMIAISIFRNQLFTATRTWAEIDYIISGMLLSVKNAFHVRAYSTAMAAIGTGILEATFTGNAYNLLAEAHKRGIVLTVTTAAEAKNNYEFQKFAMEFMSNTKDQMAAVNAFYNDHYLPTQTAREDNRLVLLSQFANRLKFGVRADTFHEELIGVGDFKRIADWQGNAGGTNGNAGQMQDANGNYVEPYRWEDASKVMITVDAIVKQKLVDAGFSVTSIETWVSENVFTLENVVGFMYDKNAIGMILNKENVYSEVNPVDGKTNTFYHGLFNIAVNSAKNKAVFYIANDTP